MADLPTRDELFRRFRAAALAVPSTRISAREIDREGSDINIIAAGSALCSEEIVNRQARAVGDCFEDTASGAALDRVIFDRKGLTRLPAAPSVGTITLQRPTAAVGAGTIDGGLPGSDPPPTRIKTNAGVVYLLTQPAVFSGAALGPITVTIQAELAGLDSEVDANQSWSFLDPSFDPTITITNVVQTAGAADEEVDEDFRRRAKNFFPTVRRGTLPAIEFGLLSTPGIATVAVQETISVTGLPAGSVQVFVLDAAGRSNETLVARGMLSLNTYRAAGIPVIGFNATPQFIEILLALAFDSSVVLDTAQAAENVRTAIVASLNNQIPGQDLLRSTIISAVRSVPGVLFEDTDLLEPTGTLVPASNSIVFRTRRELIELATE